MIASIGCRFFRGRLKGDYPMMAYWTLELVMMDAPTVDLTMFPAALIPPDLSKMGLDEKHRREGFLGYGLITPSELVICHYRPGTLLIDFVAYIRGAFRSSQARVLRISDYSNAEMLLAERNGMRPLGPLFHKNDDDTLH